MAPKKQKQIAKSATDPKDTPDEETKAVPGSLVESMPSAQSTPNQDHLEEEKVGVTRTIDEIMKAHFDE
jgi:hypothetical protein